MKNDYSITGEYFYPDYTVGSAEGRGELSMTKKYLLYDQLLDTFDGMEFLGYTIEPNYINLVTEESETKHRSLYSDEPENSLFVIMEDDDDD